MPKITCPLFSLEARGSVSDALTFSKRKTGQQVRFQRKQKDRITSSRISQRDKFLLAVSWWHQLNTIEKSEWFSLAQ